MDKDEATMREEIFAVMAEKFENIPEGQDKDRVLHMIRIGVNSIPYADLKIKWFEVVGK